MVLKGSEKWIRDQDWGPMITLKHKTIQTGLELLLDTGAECGLWAGAMMQE